MLDAAARWIGVDGPQASWPQRLLIVGNLVGIAGLAAIGLALLAANTGGDAHAYWSASQADPYRAAVDQRDAYLYSPAFLQVLAPLQFLPWEVFRAIWLAMGIATLAWLTGPITALLLLLPGAWSPVYTDLFYGNVMIFAAACTALGLRYPGAWAFLALTKITPGIAIAWHALRREWFKFAVAVGLTATISILSFAIAPSLWADWVGVLAASSERAVMPGAAIPSLALRLVLGVVLLSLAAWRGWPMLLPVVVLLAQPVLWFSSLTILLAWFVIIRLPEDQWNEIRRR